MNSRELVKRTLEHRNETGRLPRQLWHLPWAEIKYPGKVKEIQERFVEDIVGAPSNLAKPLICKGNQWGKGIYIDEWGCILNNVHQGIIGEAKEALVKEEYWEDIDNIHVPEELLTFDVDEVNEFCRNTENLL